MAWGAIAGAAAGVAGSLLGGKGGSSGAAAGAVNPMMEPIFDQYKKLYQNYYWPIEENLAKWYKQDIETARPYDERMRDYQLGRGDELVDLANTTNPILDQTRVDLINRLTEDPEVLASQYRDQASTDVASAYGQQALQNQRSASMYGLNPNSGAFRNMLNSNANSMAQSQASARTLASREAENVSLDRQNQALGLAVNPQSLFDPGTLNPGISVSGLLNAGQQSAQNSMANASAKNAQSNGLWSGIGGIAAGLGSLIK